MLLVFRNCYTFNRPGQDAYEMGRDVENYFLSKWEFERRKEIAVALYQQSLAAAEAAGSDILVTSKRKARRNPPMYDAVNRKVIYEPVSSSSSAGFETISSWREAAQNFYKTIVCAPTMIWFLKPVHKYPEVTPEVVRAYYQLIKQPMDLETVGRNLPNYPSPAELRKDLEHIVTNCVRFNPPGSPVNVAALELQAMITKAFQDPLLLTAANSLPREWKKARKILPDIPGDFVPPPVPAGPTVIRLKRAQSVVQPPPSGVEDTPGPVVQQPLPKQPKLSPATQNDTQSNNILLLVRPMTPPPMNPSDWKQLAQHVLNELVAIKDESSGTRLSWIFQKPIFKYDLPAGIKRLYLLSITELVDLGLIQTRLNNGEYDPDSFEKDVERMMDNCLVFNDETQYPHKVAFVLKRHFVGYWRSSGLAHRARELFTNRFGGNTFTPGENANLSEIRQQATPEAVIPKDCDSITGSYPLNEELLYEWRVSQRFIMHELRKKRQQEAL
jgi:hypothetical protein